MPEHAPPARSTVRRLQLVDLEQVQHTQAGQEWVPHWHEDWSFGAVVQGRCRCSVGGQRWQPGAGDLIAIAPGTVHTGVLEATGAPVLVVMFYVPGRWLRRAGLVPPAASGLVPAPELAARAAALDTLDAVQAWLHAAVGELGAGLAAAQAGPGPTAAEHQVLAGLRAAVTAGETRVAALAQRCGVGRRRLHQVLVRWTGTSPSDYLRQARLHQARQRLDAGESLAEVAAACGFADQAHFTRWFRRAFGYTPGDWLQAGR